jgi:hypothetical protein
MALKDSLFEHAEKIVRCGREGPNGPIPAPLAHDRPRTYLLEVQYAWPVWVTVSFYTSPEMKLSHTLITKTGEAVPQ